MRIHSAAILVAAITCTGLAWAADAPATQPTTAPASAVTLKTDKDKISYAIGLQIGGGMKQDKVDIDVDMLTAGMRDALSGAKPAMTPQEMAETMRNFQKQMMEKMKAEEAAVATNNQKAGEAFLAENAKKDGVKTTASGLQYKVLKSGTGKSPKADDVVVVNYKGTLINGKQFDSSYDRGKPATFPANRVIPGWTEALQLMKEGDKFEIVVPSKLGYGPEGAGEEIGPNETLVFEVELLNVKAPETQPAAEPK